MKRIGTMDSKEIFQHRRGIPRPRPSGGALPAPSPSPRSAGHRSRGPKRRLPERLQRAVPRAGGHVDRTHLDAVSDGVADDGGRRVESIGCALSSEQTNTSG